MGLTRKMLKAFGIEDDTIEQIIEAHVETTDSLKSERDKYKVESQKVGALESQVAELTEKLKNAQSEDEGRSEELNELQTKYEQQTKELEKAQSANEKLKAEYDEYKGGVEAKETKRAKQSAFKKLLGDSGFAQKYVDVIVRATPIEDIELGDDGEIVNGEEFAGKMKEQWPEFVPTVETKGSDPDTPPEPSNTPTGANPIAVQIAKERHERLYGKSEE